MTANTELKKNMEIQKPASEVWKALTDPGMIKEYFFGTEVVSDWKEGTPIIFRGSWEGQEYEDKGTILQLIPEKLLKYNYWSNLSGTEDIPENYANITYELEEEPNKTVLTVTQDGFKTREAMEHSDKSWESVLNDMKNMLENKQL